MIPTQQAPGRLEVVDALRGFAIVAILWLHNLEHFDVYHLPESLPEWLVTLDTFIWEGLFSLFAGKAFAIFALLFGLTFYIQERNQLARGRRFGPRFAWRLLLLLGFGLVNSAFFQGDILAIYAILGLLLIPVAKWRTKWLIALATLLFLLPMEWVALLRAGAAPPGELSDPASWAYFGESAAVLKEGHLFAVIANNLSTGKQAVLLWYAEQGRYFLILSFFLFGIVAGRRQLFVERRLAGDEGQFLGLQSSKVFWKRAMICATLAFGILFTIKSQLGSWVSKPAVLRPAETIVATWTNGALLVLLVGGFVLLFWSRWGRKYLSVFIPLGKMSLTNYVVQSILGTFIYYGYGLGWWVHTGATSSLLIGVGLSVLMWYFSRWWLQRHRRGPLEQLWHRATWWGRGNEVT